MATERELTYKEFGEFDASKSRSQIIEYIKLGHMMSFKYGSIINGGIKKIYHPLSVIESLTSQLLLNGHYLEKNNSGHIPKLTKTDITVARLYFLYNFDLEDYSVDGFDSEFPYSFFNDEPAFSYYTYNSGNKKAIKENILEALIAYENVHSLSGANNSDNMTKIHHSFIYELYKETFMYLYNKHKEKLKEFKVPTT
jgi:hypothetical protein